MNAKTERAATRNIKQAAPKAELRQLGAALEAYHAATTKSERKAKFDAAAKLAASAHAETIADAVVQCLCVTIRDNGHHPAAADYMQILAPEAGKRGLIYGTPDKIQPAVGAYVATRTNGYGRGRVLSIGSKNIRVVGDNGASLTAPKTDIIAVVKLAPAAPAAPAADKPAADKPADEPATLAAAVAEIADDIAGWRELVKTNADEARAQVATWAALLPVSDEANAAIVATLDTLASVAHLCKLAGKPIPAIAKYGNAAAAALRDELAKIDKKAVTPVVACLSL